MGRSIEVTNAGVYIQINRTEDEMYDFFRDKGTDVQEWVSELDGELFNQGEMPPNIICVSDEKYDLSKNVTAKELDELYENFTEEYEGVLDDLAEIFSDDISVKIGIIVYSDETY